MKSLNRLLKVLAIILTIGFLLLATPRIWSALHPNDPPVGYHFMVPTYLAIGVGLEKLVDRQPVVPQEIEEIKNIEYKNVNGKSLQIDMYKPGNLTEKVPLLVLIHGGGWRGGDRADYKVYMIPFAKEGYITATVSYRFISDSPYPGCAEDIEDAVQWFFNNSEKYGYDPDRIALIGGSAGGHLALLGGYGWKSSAVKNDTTLTNNENIHRIKAVVDFYGPADLTTEYARNHSTVTSFLQKTYDEAPELFLEASPVHYLDKNDPPTLIFQGTSDELVPVSQSDNLKKQLDSLGVPAVYYRLPLWPHTMDAAQRVNDYCRSKMDLFFKQYLN